MRLITKIRNSFAGHWQYYDGTYWNNHGMELTWYSAIVWGEEDKFDSQLRDQNGDLYFIGPTSIYKV